MTKRNKKRSIPVCQFCGGSGRGVQFCMTSPHGFGKSCVHCDVIGVGTVPMRPGVSVRWEFLGRDDDGKDKTYYRFGMVLTVDGDSASVISSNGTHGLPVADLTIVPVPSLDIIQADQDAIYGRPSGWGKVTS